jgi:phosphodiesterase/alkaline phosphatase D-like protein
MADRPDGISESFGTIRYGRLAEVLLYDIRRTATLAGPSAVYVDLEVERWLAARMAASEVAHVVHAPSNPPGWSAGKWGEWYPDVLGPDNKLTTKVPKPYWQPGWLKQHDRIMAAMSAMKARAPLVVSGDMHSIALGKMLRSGDHDFNANPITVCLSGTGGTRPLGWPSAGFRKTPALPSQVLDFVEQVKPLELHGFTLVDFLQDKMVLQQFRWDMKTQTVEMIDTLQPFHTAELPRPA